MDWHKDTLTLQTKIDADYKTTQNVRRFFAEQIGGEIHFSRAMMQWLKSSSGKTLGEAIEQYKKSK